MKALLFRAVFVITVLSLIAACSPKFYRPPALGAEYQVDRGLPPEKNPSSLFGKKMEKDLTQKGILHNSSKKDKGNAKKVIPSDTAKADTTKKTDKETPVDSTAGTTSSPEEKKE